MLFVPLELASEREIVGGKAAQLGRLHRSRIRVPPAVCVTVEGMEHLDSGDFAAELSQQLTQIPGEKVAVRSSAVGEDDVTHSYAGVFTSVLRVPASAEHVIEALREVRDSLDGAAAEAYRARWDIPRGAMAAIVQQMIEPEVVGVLFTRDPITGEPHYMVETSRWSPAGTGTAPYIDHFLMTPRAEIIEGPGDAYFESLPRSLLPRLAAIGRRCERLGGGPQDVEWAVASDDLWTLQCRPISAGPVGESVV